MAGIASGLISASQQMGGAVGLAIVSGAAAAVTGSLRGTAPAQALTTGYNAGMGVAAGLTLLALLLAVVVIRAPHSSRGQGTPAGEQGLPRAVRGRPELAATAPSRARAPVRCYLTGALAARVSAVIDFPVLSVI